MIGSIRGKINLKTDKFLIVETGGVGYKIYLSSDSLSKTEPLNSDVSLFIHTHVREDAIDLYGFLTREEQELFEMLLSVPGVGPKSALGILGITTVETLKKAVTSGDTAYLTKVS